MAASTARLAVPMRQALCAGRAVSGVRRCITARPIGHRWRENGTWRALSARAALQEKKYTEDHEWIELDADRKIGTMGISNFASNALGDVVFVELPEPNRHINKGDAIGAVESVKSASDIMTPVSGTIVEANAALEESPGTINKGPEAEGWLAKIEVEDLAELDGLMSAEEYERFTKEE